MADLKISQLPAATIPTGADVLILNQAGATKQVTAANFMSGMGVNSGTGAPTVAAANGSIYLRTDGTATSTLYLRVAGAWGAAQLTLV